MFLRRNISRLWSSLPACSLRDGEAMSWVCGMLTVIEPVPEAVEAMLDQVFCGSKVEPWID